MQIWLTFVFISTQTYGDFFKSALVHLYNWFCSLVFAVWKFLQQAITSIRKRDLQPKAEAAKITQLHSKTQLTIDRTIDLSDNFSEFYS